jgi:hypothetical protein
VGYFLISSGAEYCGKSTQMFNSFFSSPLPSFYLSIVKKGLLLTVHSVQKILVDVPGLITKTLVRCITAPQDFIGNLTRTTSRRIQGCIGVAAVVGMYYAYRRIRQNQRARHNILNIAIRDITVVADVDGYVLYEGSTFKRTEDLNGHVYLDVGNIELPREVIVSSLGTLIRGAPTLNGVLTSPDGPLCALTSQLFVDENVKTLAHHGLNQEACVCNRALVQVLRNKSIHLQPMDRMHVRLAVAFLDKTQPNVAYQIRLATALHVFLQGQRSQGLLDAVLAERFIVVRGLNHLFSGITPINSFMKSLWLPVVDFYSFDQPQEGVAEYPHTVASVGVSTAEPIMFQGKFIPSVECTLMKRFDLSSRFRVRAMIGAEITPFGIVPTENVTRMHFRSVLGWYVPNEGRVFHYSTSSLCKALSCRLIGKRVDEDLLLPRTHMVGAAFLHQVLRQGHELWDLPDWLILGVKIPGGTPITPGDFVSRVSARLIHHMEFLAVMEPALVSPDEYLDIKAYVEQPHPKRDERLHAFTEMESDPNQFFELSARFAVEGKHKNFEVAKPGKSSRMYGSLGAIRLLHHPLVAERTKHALTHVFETEDHSTFQCFLSPRPPDLTVLFNDCENKVGPLMGFSYDFVCFSDDSFFYLHFHDRKIRVNLDISSNDVSNTSSAWLMLLSLQRRLGIPDEHLRYSLELACAPIEVRDRLTNLYMCFVPTVPAEWSGQDTTTVINCVASLLLGHAVHQALLEFVGVITDDNVETIVRLGCASIGYTVTMEVCEFMEDLQFLKHSPLETDIGVVAVMNTGVILKKFGTCQGILEPPLIPRNLMSSSDADKARAFLSPIVTGLAKHARTPLVEILKEIFGFSPNISHLLHDYDGAWDMSHSEVRVESLCRRYRIDPADFLLACSLYRLCGPGQVVQHSVFQVILSKDYGLDSPL